MRRQGVAGLATVTPAAGYVEPLAALAIGLAAGLVRFWAVSLKGAWATTIVGRRRGAHGRRRYQCFPHGRVRKRHHQRGGGLGEPYASGKQAVWPASRLPLVPGDAGDLEDRRHRRPRVTEEEHEGAGLDASQPAVAYRT